MVLSDFRNVDRPGACITVDWAIVRSYSALWAVSRNTVGCSYMARGVEGQSFLLVWAGFWKTRAKSEWSEMLCKRRPILQAPAATVSRASCVVAVCLAPPVGMTVSCVEGVLTFRRKRAKTAGNVTSLQRPPERLDSSAISQNALPCRRPSGSSSLDVALTASAADVCICAPPACAGSCVRANHNTSTSLPANKRLGYPTLRLSSRLVHKRLCPYTSNPCMAQAGV